MSETAHVTVVITDANGTRRGEADVPLTVVELPEPARPTPGVHDDRTPAQVKAAFPGTALTRPFIGLQTTPGSLITKATSACAPSWEAGLRPVYSIKLDRAQVDAGRWDAPVTELAEWHLGQPDADLVIWHEPEDDFTPANGGGAAFARYFNRLADKIRAKNTRMRLIYAAMGYQWAPNSAGTASIKGFTNNPAEWAQVDADVLACDVYSGQSFPLELILPEHPGFRRWHDELVLDQPYAVTERGFITSTAHQVRAEQIRRETEWLLTTPEGQRCIAYLYWNTPGTENNPAIVVDKTYGEPAVRELVAAFAG